MTDAEAATLGEYFGYRRNNVIRYMRGVVLADG